MKCAKLFSYRSHESNESVDRPECNKLFWYHFFVFTCFLYFFPNGKKVCVFFQIIFEPLFILVSRFIVVGNRKKLKIPKKVIKLAIILVGTISEPHLELGFMNILLNFQKWRKKTMDFPWGRRAGSLVFHRAYFFIRIESILSTFCS